MKAGCCVSGWDCIPLSRHGGRMMEIEVNQAAPGELVRRLSLSDSHAALSTLLDDFVRLTFVILRFDGNLE